VDKIKYRKKMIEITPGTLSGKAIIYNSLGAGSYKNY